ncbi:MAG TPA: hypothetical protein VGO91_01785 [Pyrinomonadaceae bacterium]|jgi:hypothetical protein|nr:hypothetical protein [Pyrinomonadaceae bacterium]
MSVTSLVLLCVFAPWRETVSRWWRQGAKVTRNCQPLKDEAEGGRMKAGFIQLEEPHFRPSAFRFILAFHVLDSFRSQWIEERHGRLGTIEFS